jgi:hypothetical protein
MPRAAKYDHRPDQRDDDSAPEIVSFPRAQAAVDGRLWHSFEHADVYLYAKGPEGLGQSSSQVAHPRPRCPDFPSMTQPVQPLHSQAQALRVFIHVLSGKTSLLPGKTPFP